MRVVLIGCGGFIGSHVLERLLDRPDTFIEGFDPDIGKIKQHLGHRRLRLHQAKCNQRTANLTAAIEAADAIINVSGSCDPSQYTTRPVDVIQEHLFDVYPIVELCAKKEKWLLHFSTIEVYGRTLASYLPGVCHEDSLFYELREDDTPLIMGPIPNQRWTYACAKQMTERLIYGHYSQHGLPFTIIRPVNVFGKRMNSLPFMAALMGGRPLQLVDGGQSLRTIVAAEEVAEAVELMLAKPRHSKNEIFNLGNRSNEISIAELAKMALRTYAGITGDDRYLVHPIESVSAQEFYGLGYEDADRRLPDPKKAADLLGWQPKSTVADILLKAMTCYYERRIMDSDA